MQSNSRKRAAYGLLSLALVCAVVVVGPRLTASADQADEIAQLEGLCGSPVGLNRKLVALDALRAMDTTASRAAVARLAANSDDRTAVAAISAMGRGDWSGARSALLGIFGSTSRSDTARTAAMIAWCRLRKADGATWAQISSGLEEAAGQNARLTAALSATEARLWGGGR